MVPRSAEECQVVLGRGGADIGEPLNYSTTKIDRVEQPRTVCGAEECRRVPRSADCNTTKIDRATEDGLWCRGVPKGAEECRLVPDIGEPLNYSTTIAIPLN